MARSVTSLMNVNGEFRDKNVQQYNDSPTELSAWIPLAKLDQDTILRLFCFPFAGGGASFFSTWKKYMPEGVELCAVQLPGREKRVREKPYKDMNKLIETFSRVIGPLLTTPFVCFGHSMGALIAYAMTQHLALKSNIEPIHLFMSGMYAPSRLPVGRSVANLPDESLKAELRRLNGIPSGYPEAEEMLHLMIPTLRADFYLIENYDFGGLPKLRCPITAFGGKEDSITENDIATWREATRSTFLMKMFPGDHFFVRAAPDHLLPRMVDEIKLLVTQVSRSN